MNTQISRLSNLQQRLIVGILGSALMITLIAINQWGFFGIFFLIGMSSLFEFYRLIEGSKTATPNIKLGLLTGAYNLTLTFLYLIGHAEPRWFILNLMIIPIVFLMELYRKSPTPFSNIAYTLLGLLYIVVPFCLLFISSFAVKEDGYSFQLVIGLLLMLWANDTGAYAAGKTFGKTKLFERISPNKTWEGTIGGVVLALIFGYGVSIWFKDIFLHEWIILCLIVVIIGSYGDLVESLLKRSIHKKDSGSAIPGHGGFLDRFDGLLLALPFIATYILLFV